MLAAITNDELMMQNIYAGNSPCPAHTRHTIAYTIVSSYARPQVIMYGSMSFLSVWHEINQNTRMQAAAMHVRVRVKPGRKAEAATAAPPRIKPRRTAQRRYPEIAVAFYYNMARESTQTKMTCHVAAARQPCCTIEGACSISQRQHCQRRFEVDCAHSSSCALSRMYSAASACTSAAFFTPSFIACTRHTHYMRHLEFRALTSFNHCKTLSTLGPL